MTMLKLTKNELRTQQMRLNQFQRYLPTLQLKKAMLQFEVNNAQMEIVILHEEFAESRIRVEEFSALVLEKSACDVLHYAEVLHVKKRYENIAGVEIPIFDKVVFKDLEYFLFDTPVWTDRATELLREFVSIREKIAIAEEKRRALEKELREVSIRVNLFEKVLIPRSIGNIKKIKIFLGDQQLASVAQAKVAKQKISRRRAAV
ncbi:MAG: V-type ATP synthase subunit D [Verrucomicrobia bacterium]|nr:V-type ATP synthase subunit D [Verrucomicrobiota bacterium]